MQIEVKDLTGSKVGMVDLPAEIFEAPINKDLMHQALQRQLANARLGTHNTRSRGDVAGGGRKPFKQREQVMRGKVLFALRIGKAAARFTRRTPAITLKRCRAKCDAAHYALRFQ